MISFFQRARRYSVAVLPTLFMACTPSQPESTEPQLPIGLVTKGGVITDDQDSRDYLFEQLPNGLQVLVISDPDSAKAAASLNINVGSKDDPIDAAGMAHFLEHMLFLGTDPYPTAGEYQEFIAGHGGRHNAYTAFGNTNYFFDIDAEYLDAALDRFAPFFISPTLEAAYIDREKNAVHSEYNAFIKSEYRRYVDALGEFTNPAHPFGRFNVGSLDTLTGDDLADQTRNFYQSYYSADRMALVILGQQPVTELMVRARALFSDVPLRETPTNSINEPLFANPDLPLKMVYQPAKERRNLSLLFPLPDTQQYRQSKPLLIVGDVLGHEGEGSLFQYLKSEGWAESLSAGPQIGYEGGTLFGLEIGLTKAGLQHIQEITQAVFYSVKLLNQSGVTRERYNEQADIAALNFRFRARQPAVSTVQRLSPRLRDYAPSDALRSPYILAGFNEAVIRDLLSYIRPDNLMMALADPSAKTDKNSHYYGTPYAYESVGKSELTAYVNAPVINDISLPSPNPYVPRELVVSDETSEAIDQYETDNGVALWCGSTPQFAMPHSTIRLALDNPQASVSVTAAVTHQIYAALLRQQVNKQLYAAGQVGFSTSLSAARTGLHLAVDGYSDRQPALLSSMLDIIVGFNVDEEQFSIVKQTLARGWRNADLGPPYRVLSTRLNEFIHEPYWSAEERLAVISNIEASDVQRYGKAFTTDIGAQMLILGNVDCTDRSSALALLTERFGNKLSPQARIASAVVMEPSINAVASIELDHDDLALVRYFQGSEDSVQERALFGITSHILRPRMFNELRTEQQHGYIVYSAPKLAERWPGIVMVAQTPADTIEPLVSALDNFLQAEVQHYDAMTEPEFEAHKQTLIGLLEEPAKSVSQRGGEVWRQIRQGYPALDLTQQLVTAIGSLSLPQWQAFYRAMINGDSGSELLVRTANGGDLPESHQNSQVMEKRGDLLKQGRLVEYTTP